jgi:hypothetical protein
MQLELIDGITDFKNIFFQVIYRNRPIVRTAAYELIKMKPTPYFSIIFVFFFKKFKKMVMKMIQLKENTKIIKKFGYSSP